MRKRERRWALGRGIYVAARIFLVLIVLPGLVAWDLPFLSQRVRGDNDFRAGNYEKAIEHYTKAVEDDGDDWEVLYDLGTSYYHSGEWESAVEELSRALQIAEGEEVSDSDLAHIHHNLGLAYLQLDDCENAVSELTIATELEPEDEDISRNAEFANEYCSQGGGQSQRSEREQGEGAEQDESQGQSESEQNQDQESGEQSEQQEQSDQGDQQDESEQAGQDKENETAQPDESGQEEENKQDQGENEGQGGGEGQAENQGPAQVPDDGLGLSDAQVREILEYMSRRERQNAPRYFQNEPQEGDYMDRETMLDVMRRLFLGIPLEGEQEEPDDGIDW